MGYTPTIADTAPGSAGAALNLFGTISEVHKEQSPTKDDVARLIRGKPSKGRVGSRQIRHRLRQDELERLAIARSRGYLAITPTTRGALQNAWHLDRTAVSEPCIYVQHTEACYLVSGEHNGLPITASVTSLEELQELLRRYQR